jgi:hypothetical protein
LVLSDDEIVRATELSAVEIVGAKWCGKTWAALAHARSEVHLAIVRRENWLRRTSPSPRVIDEGQKVLALWDAARRAIDAAGKHGLYILTGSTEARKDEIVHSGAGRIARLHMRSMPLAESGHFNKTVLLARLFDDTVDVRQVSRITLEKAVKHGRSPHPAFGHLSHVRAARGKKGQYSPRPLAGEGAPKAGLKPALTVFP